MATGETVVTDGELGEQQQQFLRAGKKTVFAQRAVVDGGRVRLDLVTGELVLMREPKVQPGPVELQLPADEEGSGW